MGTTSAVGGGNKSQKILAAHRTSQSQEGACGGEARTPVALAGGLCPGKRAGTAQGRLPGEGCLVGAERAGCTARVVGWLFGQGLHFSTKTSFFFSFKLPPCFSPMSIMSDVFCCFRILARLLSGYCVKFKGWERDEIIAMCSTV